MPSWIAPRLGFDFFEQRIAEDQFEWKVRVELGGGWWWYRPANALVYAPAWSAEPPEFARRFVPVRTERAAYTAKPRYGWFIDFLLHCA